MDWMPYFAAVCGFSSTLSLTTFTFGPSEPAISSSAGAMLRQGPHHSAQKSTTTGLVAFNTSDSNVLSETLPTAMGCYLVVLPEGRRTYEWGSEASRHFHGQVTAESALSIRTAGISIKSGISVHTSAARTALSGWS